MSNFTCPPSYILTKRKAKDIFPQLSGKDIKYCAVFYEAQHNDSRTNIAIAMSAAEYGAHIANYIEMVDTIRNDEGKVVGVKALDRMTLKEFDIHAKHVVFAGGPFTDSMREMESSSSSSLTNNSDDNNDNPPHTTTPITQVHAPRHISMMSLGVKMFQIIRCLLWMVQANAAQAHLTSTTTTLPVMYEVGVLSSHSGWDVIIAGAANPTNTVPIRVLRTIIPTGIT